MVDGMYYYGYVFMCECVLSGVQFFVLIVDG